MPQSNQRGIETSLDPAGRDPGREPQSNQRGIETEIDSPDRGGYNRASIEPAWD